MRIFAVLVVAALSVANAQGNAVTRYYADECAVINKEVLVAPSGLTYIEFHDVIDPGQVFSPGATMITQDSGVDETLDSGAGPVMPFTVLHAQGTNLLNLSTSLNKAETVLAVWVKGEPCNLVLRVADGLVGARRYIIEAQRPLPALTDSPMGESQTSDLNEAVEFEIMSVSAPSNGDVSVFFTLRNNSAHVMAADTSRVRFEQGGERYATQVRKEPVRQLLEPGETHTGYILVKGASAGQGQVEWALREMKGLTREVTFSETVAIPAR